jgi:hypothetical protein
MTYVSLGILKRSQGKFEEAETLMKSGRWDRPVLARKRVGWGDDDAGGAEFGLAAFDAGGEGEGLSAEAVERSLSPRRSTARASGNVLRCPHARHR